MKAWIISMIVLNFLGHFSDLVKILWLPHRFVKLFNHHFLKLNPGTFWDRHESNFLAAAFSTHTKPTSLRCWKHSLISLSLKMPWLTFTVNTSQNSFWKKNYLLSKMCWQGAYRASWTRWLPAGAGRPRPVEEREERKYCFIIHVLKCVL